MEVRRRCMKKELWSRKFICAILFTAGLVAGLSVVFNNTKNSDKTLEEVADYIENNLKTMSEEYNKSSAFSSQDTIKLSNRSISDNNGFHAESIERTVKVYVLEDSAEAIFLDFDGENGYMLVTADNELYEFETTGELDYLKDIDYAYYSTIDGFVYYDEESDSYERYDSIGQEDVLFKSIDTEDYTSLDNQMAYEGQVSDAGDGKIYDIDAYVKSRYPDYTYQSGYSISNYEFVYQWDTSVYRSDDGSEGNCVINATYSMMNHWRKSGHANKLPDTTVDYSSAVVNDALYSKYGNNSYGSWRTNSATTLSKMPSLYMHIRDYAIGYGYYPDQGMKFSYVDDMANATAKDYGNTAVEAKETSSFSTVKTYLDCGRAGAISVNGSSTFGNHAMGLCGYRVYTYQSGWWIFSSTKTAYFYQVDDGHSYKKGVYTDVFFDPNTSAKPSLSFVYLSTW